MGFFRKGHTPLADGNSKAPRSKHIPVHIDGATYTAIQSYSELTGIPITKVVATAMKDWMETIGAARLEALTATAHGDSAKLFQMRAAAQVVPMVAAGAKQEAVASA